MVVRVAVVLAEMVDGAAIPGGIRMSRGLVLVRGLTDLVVAMLREVRRRRRTFGSMNRIVVDGGGAEWRVGLVSALEV